MYSVSVENEAIKLRLNGRTHREIAKDLGIAVGTAYIWTKKITLTPKQKEDIKERRNRHFFTPAEKVIALARLKPFESKYTDQDLISKIKEFYNLHGRIPLKQEFNSFKTFQRRFGGWNKAIKLAGFDANPVLFANKFISKDGHKCDSFMERIVDEWLFDNGIEHSRNFKYGNTKMTGDFVIKPNIVIEFFGLAGVQKNYDAIIQRKRNICKELNIKLVEIYPRDIFPKNRLVDIIKI